MKTQHDGLTDTAANLATHLHRFLLPSEQIYHVLHLLPVGLCHSSCQLCKRVSQTSASAAFTLSVFGGPRCSKRGSVDDVACTGSAQGQHTIEIDLPSIPSRTIDAKFALLCVRCTRGFEGLVTSGPSVRWV